MCSITLCASYHHQLKPKRAKEKEKEPEIDVECGIENGFQVPCVLSKCYGMGMMPLWQNAKGLSTNEKWFNMIQMNVKLYRILRENMQ